MALWSRSRPCARPRPAPRLPRRAEGRGGPPARLAPVKAAALPGWPAEPLAVRCDHAGLLLLLPAITQIGLPDLISQAGYPSTEALTSWHSIGTLLLAKCARRPRVHHAGTLADDEGLAFVLGLTALPKTTHPGTYSWRVHRDCNQKLLIGLVEALRPFGLAAGEAGFNCDFHAIRHHGDQAVVEKHYVPRRSQRTRALLFAQDHASADMVYSNADITKNGRPRSRGAGRRCTPQTCRTDWAAWVVRSAISRPQRARSHDDCVAINDALDRLCGLRFRRRSRT